MSHVPGASSHLYFLECVYKLVNTKFSINYHVDLITKAMRFAIQGILN